MNQYIYRSPAQRAKAEAAARKVRIHEKAKAAAAAAAIVVGAAAMLAVGGWADNAYREATAPGSAESAEAGSAQ